MRNTMTVHDAQIRWEHTIEHGGGHCPVCTKWGAVYNEFININMLRGFIWMASFPDDQWIHLPTQSPPEVLRFKRLTMLRFWALVETRAGQVNQKTGKIYKTGWWRVSQLGREWIDGGKKIPYPGHSYKGEIISYGEETRTFSEMKDNAEHFDLQKTMGLPV